MKLNVAQRLSLLGAVLVFGLSLLAGFGLWQMERVYAAASFANENTVPALVALGKVDSLVMKLRMRVVRHVFYADDAAAMAQIDDTIVDAKKRIAAALKDYEPTIVDAEDQRRFTYVGQLIEALDACFAVVLESSRAGRKDEARDILQGADPLGKELSDALVEYTEYNVALGKKGDDEAKAIHTQARTISLTLAAVTLALVGLLSLAIARSVTRPVLAMQETIVRIGAGSDLTLRVPATTDDELGVMARHLNGTLEQIGATLRDVVAVAADVAASADQLAAATSQLTESSQAQAATAAEMAATVEEITASIGNVADNAGATEAIAIQATGHVARGEAVVREASAEMAKNAVLVGESASHIEVLSEQSRQVGGIVQVIREIADQTNLLALNAAIEAARAGETGRGFAVVADEVRKLAERTSVATAEIGQLIDGIQRDTAQAVGSMGVSSDQANKGAALAEEAGRVFAEVSGSTNQAADRVRDIAAAAREQNLAGQGISSNVEKVARMAEENSAATASVADAATHLRQLATTLDGTISRFRV